MGMFLHEIIYWSLEVRITWTYGMNWIEMHYNLFHRAIKKRKLHACE